MGVSHEWPVREVLFYPLLLQFFANDPGGLGGADLDTRSRFGDSSLERPFAVRDPPPDVIPEPVSIVGLFGGNRRDARIRDSFPRFGGKFRDGRRSEEHTSELQSRFGI